MSYQVLEYTDEHLISCFTSVAEAHDNIILAKQHLTCFKNYFSHIKIKTIIVENKYVNREFLEDYSSYYVRSFKEYKRDCVRLHFFSIQITPEEFSSILKGEPVGPNVKDLQDNYKGFMVLKPLPTTIIGKTCLSTYEDLTSRIFPTIRTYKANLFGIQLSVESLAYQEQDSIVAACASSSIWTAFHGTGILFQHSFPSPVEITNWATKYFPFANRHFPNKGLSGEQMAIAIREIGLEPYLYNVEGIDRLKATAYAYLKGKIPVVLGFSLWDTNSNTALTPARYRGKHAVTITGYNEGGKLSSRFEDITDLSLSSSKIDKFYVHDDQVGPFAKMSIEKNDVYYSIHKKTECLETTWEDSNRKIGNVKATSEILIIPLYHKIRIPFIAVLKAVNFFNSHFIPHVVAVPKFTLFEWDIFLADIKDFKNEILNEEFLDKDLKEKILTTQFPKYLWRAIGKINDEKKMEFVFDATEIDQASFHLMTINYDSIIEQQYRLLLDSYDSSLMSNLTAKKMIESYQTT